MQRKYDVITALDICVDFIVQCGNIEPEFGQKEKLIQDYDIEMGGSTCIFACQASKLTLKTAGIGVVGDDTFGRVVMDKFYKSGMNIDKIRTDKNIKTAVGVALCKEDGDRAILTYIGTIDAVHPQDITEEIISNAKHLHIGSFYLMNKLRGNYIEILQLAKKHNVTVSLDTNWDPEEKWDGGIWDILPYVDIFLPNENEAKAITKKNSIEEAIEVLSKIVPVIALKMGKHGAVAYVEGKTYKGSPIDVKVVDTVGAGDSFDAGFVYGYIKGHSIEECLQIGCICGSYNAAQSGGIKGQPKLNELLKVLYAIK
ncbi:MAG TPA: carbohydrate kinase family protein [Ruminiclostridium sp.]